jgi:hypothetical protein
MAILATNKNRSGTLTRGIHTRACSSGVATAEHRQRWSSFCRAGPGRLEGRIPFFPNPVFLIPFFLIPFSESRFSRAGPGRPDLHTRAPSRMHARTHVVNLYIRYGYPLVPPIKLYQFLWHDRDQEQHLDSSNPRYLWASILFDGWLQLLVCIRR